jgi:hypothetical protein
MSGCITNTVDYALPQPLGEHKKFPELEPDQGVFFAKVYGHDDFGFNGSHIVLQKLDYATSNFTGEPIRMPNCIYCVDPYPLYRITIPNAKWRNSHFIAAILPTGSYALVQNVNHTGREVRRGCHAEGAPVIKIEAQKMVAYKNWRDSLGLGETTNKATGKTYQTLYGEAYFNAVKKFREATSNKVEISYASIKSGITFGFKKAAYEGDACKYQDGKPFKIKKT